MYLFNSCLLVLSTVTSLDEVPYAVTLISRDSVMEYHDFLMICESNNTFNYPYSSWNQGNSSVDFTDLPKVGFFQNASCSSTHPLNDTNRYEYGCNTNRSFSLKLKSVRRNQHGENWQCFRRYSYGNAVGSNIISVYVKVPVESVNITSHQNDILILCEYSTIKMECKTSEARPRPSIIWLFQNKNSMDTFSIGGNSSTSDENGIFVTTSILHLRPNRSLSDWTIVCSSSNVKGWAVNASLKLNITHPPDNSPTIKDPNIEPGGTYSVIEHEEGKLSCVVSNSNPSAKLRWKCINDGDTTVVSLDGVKKNVVWKASRTDINVCECIAQHSCSNWNRSVIVNIQVMYPPSIPKISVYIYNGEKVVGTGMINVIERETITLKCDSKSEPKPRYTWFVNRTNNTARSDLKLTNITRSDAGNYTCHVDNLMNTTFGGAVPGNNKSSLMLNILYPADVESLSKRSLTEVSTLNISCPVIQGNPSTTIMFWTRESDGKRWNSSQLIISNVSRADDTFYTCTVLSEMVPTFGNVSKISRISRFHLNVFYSAEVKVFSLIREKLKEYFEVNQTEKVTFVCTVEANPASEITIVTPKLEQINTHSHTNNVSHTLQNTSCESAGEYICTGRNNYTTGEESSSKLILIVRCPPRPTTENKNDVKMATAQHVEVILRFTARNYLDLPDKTTFRWFKDNVSLESYKNRFRISSYGLQSNLSIKNITQAEFGQYQVRVLNSNGQYIHLYEVMAKDKPEAPKDFIFIDDSITDSSVILKWMPGFNGGYPQTFFLLYKGATGKYWQNISIKETGKNQMNYTLSSLFSVMEYRVKTFARNDVGDSAHTNILTFRTKAPLKAPIESHPSSMTGTIAGSVSSCIVIVAIVIAVVLIYRKRKNKETGTVYQNVQFSGRPNTTQRKGANMPMVETLFEGLQEVDDVPIITNERTEYCNAPDIIEKIDRIKVIELFSYVSGRSEDSFEADYQKLPTELQKPCTFARKPENIALNRYNGIYPYDHSRVKLQGHPYFFINACYIEGYKRSKAYIASLGPTAKTTNDFLTFWEMIWYEKVDVIVMLTNLREPSGMKCEKYWPEGCGSISYGDVCVSSVTTNCFAEYTIRTFSVSKEKERRSLTHLHYTAWPDKTVPEDVTSLIEFRQRMKITTTSNDGPVVIHCSAGIGRTGTLIALDRLIEEGQDKGSLNVFECVDNMREQRVKMVQTFEQYMYIYKALVNALTFDCETIPVETFNEYVDATNNNMYSMMFQQLRQSVETDSKSEVEVRRKNEKLTDKNRLGADIPGSRFRAMLYLNRTDAESEYINAVYINSFVKRDYFIAAQSPLPSTVADFLTLVYQEDCSCIATMEDLKDPGMTVGQYLPDDKKTLTVGNFKVSSSRLETKHNYVVRKMKIKYSGKFDSGEKIIYHFQYAKWMTGNDTPMNAKEFVQFVNEVKEYANELGEERSHVIVHCLKANERSGLFCAMAILMEKIKLERQVNVLNTLRHLRTRRQTAITSMEQLKFCFQATSEYIKMNMLG